MSSFLAALAKNATASGLVVPKIDEHLMLLDAAQDDRRDFMFHPSDLAGDFCPRAWALYNYHPQGLLTKVGAIDPRAKRIFGNGHGVHHRLQGYLGDMGVLWGRWRKLVSWRGDDPVFTEYVGFKPDEPGWAYDEVGLEHEADRIVGHTDGLLLIDDAKWGLEVKSIKDERFRWLKDQPNPQNREQTLIYMHCLEDARQTALREGSAVDWFDELPFSGFVVVYENKNTQELKEFPVKFDAQEIANLMAKKRKRMKLALEYAATKVWPDCLCGKYKSALCEAFDNL